jgi:hypothetical protein
LSPLLTEINSPRRRPAYRRCMWSYGSMLACLLLASCAMTSNWHLMDSGYSIERLDGGDFAFELHRNQLKQLGGELKGAQVHQFVAERLKLHQMCPAGWAPLPCVEDGSCVRRTERSITILGRYVS